MREPKTVDLTHLLNFANKELARTEKFITKDYKAGIKEMLEEALNQAKQPFQVRFINPKDRAIGSEGYYSRIYSFKQDNDEKSKRN